MLRNCCAVGALFCCLPLIAETNAPAIAVFMDFERQPSAASVSQMEKEIAAIMQPSGLRFDWRLMSERRPDETYPDVVVLKFKGSCQMRDSVAYSELGPMQALPLASTKISDGHILPFSDVECDEIRRYIAPNVLNTGQERRETIYGKALGRVVAHELYHIFAGTRDHAHEGVARATHSRRELTSNQFRFTAQESLTLHELKWRSLLAGEGQLPSAGQ